MIKFTDGVCYVATNTVDSNKKTLVVASGRYNGEITFARVGEVANSKITIFDGKETAKIQMNDGVYFVSPSIVADPGSAVRTINMILAN